MEPTTTTGFGGMLELLKQGKFVTREGWNGKGMYLGLQTPDEHSANKGPYIWIMPVDGKRIPWTASQKDIFAEDWREAIIGGVTPTA